MTKTVFVVVLLAAAVAWTGCGRKKEKLQEEAAERIVSRALSAAGGQDFEVDIEGEQVTFTDRDGNVTVRAGKGTGLPEGFPGDVPVYKKAEVLQSASTGADAFSMTFQCGDDVSKVSGFYKEQMESQGWESQTAMDMPGRSILAYKKDNRMVSLMIAGHKDGGTVVTVSGGADE